MLCNSVSADRIVMAASRLLGATAACVILLSFAAGHRKLYWNGCIMSARVICQRIFPILALCVGKLCVWESGVWVSGVCVSSCVCVSKLCVSKLCASKLCVGKLCVSKL